MRVLKIYQFQIVLVVLFAVLTICFFRNESDINGEPEYVPYNEDWSCNTEGKQVTYAQLPKKVENTNQVVLKRLLTEEVIREKQIGFYTAHQLVEVSVDGEKLYSKEVPKDIESKTTGKCWNFVKIKKSYEGKQLTIKINNCYRVSNLKVPYFYYGSKSAIVIKVIKDNLVSMIISVMMLVVGTIMVMVWYILGNKIYLHRGMLWLGLFTISLALWSGMETHILQIMYGREVLFGGIACLGLKLMVCPAVRLIQVLCHEEHNKIMNLLCIAGIADFMVSFVLQLFAVVDLGESLWVTHLLLGGAVAAVVMVIIKQWRRKKRRLFENKSVVWINAIGIGILGICIVADVVNYNYRFANDMAMFTRMGWLVYIAILGLQLFAQSAKLVQEGKKIKIIKEEAEQDGLTHVKNRKSFEDFISLIPTTEYARYSMVMFDLNDLKTMNDQFGHGMGDCYLIISSEIIRDIYGEYGEIYRIGGDEFCLISTELEEEEYLECEKRMCDWMRSLKGTQAKDFMKIASGYAKYNCNRDITIQEIGRASCRERV